VRLRTLGGAAAAGHVGSPVELGASSWGSGKDWRVWDNPAVSDLAAAAAGVQRRLLSIVDVRSGQNRDPVLDQLAREAFLAMSSDWAFMVTKDSAAGYARARAAEHAARFHRLADLLDRGEPAAGYAAELRRVDGPFGHLDARSLRTASRRPAQPASAWPAAALLA
jgi:1,4-alpha-glucan branching enzyme